MTQSAGVRQQRLCTLFGIERPVLLAPMAPIAGGRLAAAVSNAGGLGLLGAGYGDLDWLDAQAELAGDARVGIGLITWNMGDDALTGALAHRPAAVWLSFGDPTPHIETIHDAGALAICQVGLVDEAVAAVEAGADAIVVQGSEAGGHGRPGRALFGLIPAVVDAIGDVPVIAAGGITGPDGLAAAGELGASGVALGTALYATTEANDIDAAKQRLVDAGGDDTIHSTVYDHIRGPLWPPGYTGRSIRTELTDRWAGREGEMGSEIGSIKERYLAAEAESDMTQRVVFAGDGLDRIHNIVPAETIVHKFPRPLTVL